MDVLYDHVILFQISLVDGLILLLRVCLTKEDLYRHKRTVLLKHFPDTVFVGEFNTVLIQKQGDLRSYAILISLIHLILCTAVADPMYRSCALLIRQSIDVHLVRHHERGIKTKSKVTDHVVFRSLIFIFFKELCSAGERNLRNILLHFVGSHTKSVICEL